MTDWPKQLAIGVGASLLVHCAMGAALWANRGVDVPPLPEPTMVMVDIDEAPTADEAHTPTDDPEPKTAPDTPASTDTTDPANTDVTPPEPAATVDPTPPPVREPDPPEPTVPVVDAGVPDAAPPPDARRRPDARQPPAMDAMPAANLADAGRVDAASQVPDAGAPPVVAASPAGDAGSTATPKDAGATAVLRRDGGTGDGADPVAAAAARDGGIAARGDAGAGPMLGGVPALPGADANLLTYVPKVERVAVMIRFERMRGTEWVRHTEAVLEPMPDYQLLFSQSSLKPGDAIDTLVISSSKPRDLTATTLGVKVGGWTAERLRRYVNRPNAPVAWSPVRGGVLGTRGKSRLVHPRDSRVFLMPYPGWIILSRTAYLGNLLGPTTASLTTARATAGDLPGWLARMRRIEREAGTGPTGPSLLLTMNGFKNTLKLPLAGTLPAPERITLALEIAPKGFRVRGELKFAAPDKAAAFVKEVDQFKATFVGTSVGKRALGQVHAYNALANLSMKQGGSKVGFSTSISIADGRLMMRFAATETRRMFGSGGRRLRRTKPAPKPRQPATPAPKPAQPAPPNKAAPAAPKPRPAPVTPGPSSGPGRGR